MPDLDREFISLGEVATVLICTEHQVIELLRNGTLPGMKPGRSWVIPRQAFVTAVNVWAERAAYEIQCAAQPQVPGEPEPTGPLANAVGNRGRGRSRTVMPSPESLGLR